LAANVKKYKKLNKIANIRKMDLEYVLERRRRSQASKSSQDGSIDLLSQKNDALFEPVKRKSTSLAKAIQSVQKSKSEKESSQPTQRRPSTVAASRTKSEEASPSSLFPSIFGDGGCSQRRPSTVSTSAVIYENQPTSTQFPHVFVPASQAESTTARIPKSRASLKSLFGSLEVGESLLNNSTTSEEVDQPIIHTQRRSSKTKRSSKSSRSLKSLFGTMEENSASYSQENSATTNNTVSGNIPQDMHSSRLSNLLDNRIDEESQWTVVDNSPSQFQAQQQQQQQQQQRLQYPVISKEALCRESSTTSTITSVEEGVHALYRDITQGNGEFEEDLAEPPTKPPPFQHDISLEAKKVAAVVCKDAYISMMMEKELLKRRMRKHEINSQEYKQLCREAAVKFQNNYDETLQLARESVDEGIDDAQFEELRDLRNSCGSGGGGGGVGDRPSWSVERVSSGDTHTAIIAALAYQREQEENRHKIQSLLKKRSPRAGELEKFVDSNGAQIDPFSEEAIETLRSREKSSGQTRSNNKVTLSESENRRLSDHREASLRLSQVQARSALQLDSDSDDEGTGYFQTKNPSQEFFGNDEPVLLSSPSGVSEVKEEELLNLAISYENLRALRRRSFLRLHRSRRQAQKSIYQRAYPSSTN
jgi:hypothetical protein